MIRKLRRQFIVITLLALTAAMLFLAGVVNLSNWIIVRRELLDTVALIAQTHTVSDSFGSGFSASDSLGADPGAFATRSGELPEGWPDETPPPFPEEADTDASARPDAFRFGRGNPFWARERLQQDRHARNLVNESRWFSVRRDEAGVLSLTDAELLSSLPDLSEEQGLALAANAFATGWSSGFIGDYAFQTLELSDQSLVFFMSCETRLAAVRSLLLISAAASVAGILLAWLFVTLASHRAVQPTLRNMEQQKRFITDASHELKTPLTVISTNMELLQMEQPGNPWVQSTQKQTASLRHLVDELVYLSRMEEENPTLQMEPLRVASLVRDAAEPFQAMAEYNGTELLIDADDSLWVNADPASMQRLLSTLLDNAAKYAQPDSPIRVSVSASGKHARISVSNAVAEPLTPEQCRHLFDRFYRTDPSRNKEKKSGFGIGLSIASAIAQRHGGSISAEMETDHRLALTVLLPRIQEPQRRR